jgi:hypothetical protein
MQYNRGRGLPQTYRLCDLKSYLTDPKTAIIDKQAAITPAFVGAAYSDNDLDSF